MNEALSPSTLPSTQPPETLCPSLAEFEKSVGVVQDRASPVEFG